MKPTSACYVACKLSKEVNTAWKDLISTPVAKLIILTPISYSTFSARGLTDKLQWYTYQQIAILRNNIKMRSRSYAPCMGGKVLRGFHDFGIDLFTNAWVNHPTRLQQLPRMCCNKILCLCVSGHVDGRRQCPSKVMLNVPEKRPLPGEAPGLRQEVCQSRIDLPHTLQHWLLGQFIKLASNKVEVFLLQRPSAVPNAPRWAKTRHRRKAHWSV